MDSLDFEQSALFLRERDHFMLLAHVNPDGDAFGATLGLARLLERLGKKYVLYAEEPVPVRYRFLHGADRYVQSFKEGTRFTTAVALDCGDRTRMGSAPEWFADSCTLLNIDHHSTNDLFGAVNLVNTKASATSEIVYRLIKHMGITFDLELASCLYAGIVFDTGGFRYNNTSGDVLRAAAELLETGINGYDITDQVLEMSTWAELQLTRQALTTVEYDPVHRIATMYITRDMLQRANASDEDVEGLVGYVRGLQGVEVGVLIRELLDGRWKISLRSKREVNVAQLAQRFGGGGHVRAAGCVITGSLEEVRRQLLDALREGFASS